MAVKIASRRSRRRRNQRRRRVLYGLAAAGLVVTTITAVILFVTLRPVTLRIAVASVSEDAKMVEAIARVFTRERSSVRLLLTVMEQGQAEALLNAGGADLAVVRSDAMPSNCSAIAILRKRALFVWTATSPGQKTDRKSVV